MEPLLPPRSDQDDEFADAQDEPPPDAGDVFPQLQVDDVDVSLRSDDDVEPRSSPPPKENLKPPGAPKEDLSHFHGEVELKPSELVDRWVVVENFGVGK